MPDLDTQLADYADWLADRADPVSAEEATTSPAPAVTLEPNDHEAATARRRRARLAVVAAAVLLVGVLVATLLPTNDQDDVETGPVAPITGIGMGWERTRVDWEGGTPIDIASNGDGILRAVIATPIRCPSPGSCGPDLAVWESSDDGRSWRRQGSLAPGSVSVDGNAESYRSVVAIAGNGPNWIVVGNRSDQPVVWLPASDGEWTERDLPDRPGLPRAAIVEDDSALLVVGWGAGRAVAWASDDDGQTWRVDPLSEGEPVPGGPTSAGTPTATSVVALADELVAFGVGGDGRPAMWSRDQALGWTEDTIPARFALARTISDGHTIWAVEAISPSPDGRVALWTRRDQSWQETKTPVPWSADALTQDQRVEVFLRDTAPALSANEAGVVMASHDGDGQALWASPDGAAWAPTDASTPEGTTIVAIAAHGEGFAAVSSNQVWVWQPR